MLILRYQKVIVREQAQRAYMYRKYCKDNRFPF